MTQAVIEWFYTFTNQNKGNKMVKYHVVEEGSSVTWTSFFSLEEAIKAVSNKAKPYYIYKQNTFSTESCGVWYNGSKIADEKDW